MGDSSDNYAGVKGIGEKTALKLLHQYGTIEGILENISALTKAQRSKIETDLDMLHLSRDLAAIRCNVEIDFPLEEALLQVDEEKMAWKFNELEFKNWRKNLI